VFKPSEFAIINTDGHSDFDIEDSLTLRDQSDRVLNVRINYMWAYQSIPSEHVLSVWCSRHPESGGAFKAQIFSPYIIVNKTGLPFWVKAVRATRSGSQEAAGDVRQGEY
jgi:vacuolar protein sorting-associated protein 13A/C